MGLLDIVKPGVIYGEDVYNLFKYAQRNSFAIPSVNCTSPSAIKVALDAARHSKSPIIIQISNAASLFFAGNGLGSTDQTSPVAGAIAAAHHVRDLAQLYAVPIILHSGHCSRKLLPWLDGMLAEDERHFAAHGTPLFSSHMLDLTEDPSEDNLKIYVQYLERMARMNCLLEVELGVTGGKGSGSNDTDREWDTAHSKPEEVNQIYTEMSKVSCLFSVSAAFGSFHGVYRPADIKLLPEQMEKIQLYIKSKHGLKDDKPILFALHGGPKAIKSNMENVLPCGVVKVSIDTDSQWAYWEGIIKFYKAQEGHKLEQVEKISRGVNENEPYDPNMWLQKAEESSKTRLIGSFTDLKCFGTL